MIAAARSLAGMEYAAFEVTTPINTTPKDTLKFAAKEVGRRFIEDDWYLVGMFSSSSDGYTSTYTVMVGR